MAGRFWILAVTLIALVGPVREVRAQSVEIAPIAGYSAGGDIFEVAAHEALDADAAPALGAVVDIPLSNGWQLEGLFSHQWLDVPTKVPPLGFVELSRISVDHIQLGGITTLAVENDTVQPFMTGLLGLTHYAAEGDHEVRFSFGGGGGVKWFPTSHVGVRLDGRLFATFVDASTSGGVCGGAGCLFGLRVFVVWQAQFTAGLVVRLP